MSLTATALRQGQRFSQGLGRLPMYRVVTLSLLGLATVALIQAWTGTLEAAIFAPNEMVLTLVVLVAASLATNAVLGLVTRSSVHLESSLITALLLWFIFWPSGDAWTLQWLAITAALANVSKFLFAWRRRHIFNPVAAGVVTVMVIQELLGLDLIDRTFTTSWIASESLFWWVAVASALILWRTGRIAIGATFVLLAAALFLFAQLNAPSLDETPSVGPLIEMAFYSTPVVFLAGFMLSEPLTLPPRRWQQLVVAATCAVLVMWPALTSALTGDPMTFWIFSSMQELGLLGANLVAFAFAVRGRLRFTVTGQRDLGEGNHELLLTPDRPIAFTPGQFLELHVPHRSDLRGPRRMLSIASAPGDAVRLGLRVGVEPSSFKAATISLPIGTQVTSTGIWGDFVLPKAGTDPVVLVAGGIGITPFLAMMEAHPERHFTLIYGISGSEIPFAAEIEATNASVVLVSAQTPTTLPRKWRHVAAPEISADVVVESVEGPEHHVALVSGPPAMVSAVAGGLRHRVAKVKTDHFDGY